MATQWLNSDALNGNRTQAGWASLYGSGETATTYSSPTISGGSYNLVNMAKSLASTYQQQANITANQSVASNTKALGTTTSGLARLLNTAARTGATSSAAANSGQQQLSAATTQNSQDIQTQEANQSAELQTNSLNQQAKTAASTLNLQRANSLASLTGSTQKKTTEAQKQWADLAWMGA